MTDGYGFLSSFFCAQNKRGLIDDLPFSFFSFSLLPYKIDRAGIVPSDDPAFFGAVSVR